MVGGRDPKTQRLAQFFSLACKRVLVLTCALNVFFKALRLARLLEMEAAFGWLARNGALS